MLKNKLIILTCLILSIKAVFPSTIIKSGISNIDLFPVNCHVEIYAQEFNIIDDNSFSNELTIILYKQNHLTDYDINIFSNKLTLRLTYNFIDNEVYSKWFKSDSLNLIVKYLKLYSDKDFKISKYLHFKKIYLDNDILNNDNLASIDSLNIPVNFHIVMNKKCDNSQSNDILLNLLQKVDSLKQIIYLGYNINEIGFNTGINFKFDNKNQFYYWYKSAETTDFMIWLNSLKIDNTDKFSQSLNINYVKFVK